LIECPTDEELGTWHISFGITLFGGGVARSTKGNDISCTLGFDSTVGATTAGNEGAGTTINAGLYLAAILSLKIAAARIPRGLSWSAFIGNDFSGGSVPLSTFGLALWTKML
jgi:hypothetical protein